MSVRVSPSLAIVGGGLAGLAAAEAASRCGFRVELFEARRRLGGRAAAVGGRGSEGNAWTSGSPIDQCQHVALGCCTNFLELLRRTDSGAEMRRVRTLVFVGPDGRAAPLGNSRWLPAPFHLGPGLLRLQFLTLGERFKILQTMARLLRQGSLNEEVGTGQWLREQGHSANAIERFWFPVLVSALSERLDEIPLKAAMQVFRQAFLSARQGYEMYLTRRPLGEVLDRCVADELARRSVVIHRRMSIQELALQEQKVTGVVLPDGSVRRFDTVLLAVPWRDVSELFPCGDGATLPEIGKVGQIDSRPITAVHLWFEQPITGLEQAALVGGLAQWVFAGPTASNHPDEGYHYQVVISNSRELRSRPREDVVQQVCRELEGLGSRAKRARLLHWWCLTHPHAVFAPSAANEDRRLTQRTRLNNLYLAGDWTTTGWPATMEGAVRSGYLAMEAILQDRGRRESLLAPDLPVPRLVRWLRKWAGSDESGKRDQP